MPFSTANTSYGLFPAAPCSPNAFSLFGSTSNPRDNHVLCEEFGAILHPSAKQQAKGSRRAGSPLSDNASYSSSAKSTKSSFKRWFGFN
ncbi:hypothetical protein EST38_g1256 [Candolleomyces aberdarensis]|uniref:Uncharacterized protein n=1 Tax=Candolleomyces aberdarensis TaxID=2316362 RepID=A0A4Q2DZ66_9AGAR|nr:hypothetical protein EST38_g1256 [Candolleomyces aberdarensis]